MVGKGQGRVKSGFRARLATVAVTRGSVALTDGGMDVSQAQTTERLFGAVRNLSYFPALPCPNLVYMETRADCSGP